MDSSKLVQKPTKHDIEMRAYTGNPEWVLSNRGHKKFDERVKALLNAYKSGEINEIAVYSDIGHIVALMEKEGAAALLNISAPQSKTQIDGVGKGEA